MEERLVDYQFRKENMMKSRFNNYKVYYAAPEYLLQMALRIDLMPKADKHYYLEAVERVKKSIEENGFNIKARSGNEEGRPNIPIVQFDSYGFTTLADGNHRVRASVDLGLEKIPFWVEFMLSDGDIYQQYSALSNSKHVCYKYIIEKYPGLKNDKELKDILSSAAYGICENPVKICTEELIQENLTYNEDWETMVLPPDFIEKTDFQLL